MRKNISLISVCLIFLVACGVNAGEQTNYQLGVPKVNDTNLAVLVTETVRNIQTARQEIDDFLKTNTERKKNKYTGWWYVEHKFQGATNGYIYVIFDKKDGAPIREMKRFFADPKYTNSIGGYDLYFHSNGTVKSFTTFGTNQQILRFEDSGMMKDFVATEGKGTIAELRCNKDGRVEYEKISKDKEHKSEGEGVSPANKP